LQQEFVGRSLRSPFLDAGRCIANGKGPFYFPDGKARFNVAKENSRTMAMLAAALARRD